MKDVLDGTKVQVENRLESDISAYETKVKD